MNLELSAADLAFQAEVRAFLADNLPGQLEVAGPRVAMLCVEIRSPSARRSAPPPHGWAERALPERI